MQPIHPICENTLRGYIGKPICAVLHDGSYFYGTVSEVRDGKVYLGPAGGPGQGSVSTNRSRAKRRLAAKRRPKNGSRMKASVSAFFPGSGYPRYPIGAVGLELGLIACCLPSR